MALQILRPIRAVAVELGLRRLQYLGAGGTRMGTMGVDVLAHGKLDMDGLCGLALDGLRALVVVAPFIADLATPTFNLVSRVAQ